MEKTAKQAAAISAAARISARLKGQVCVVCLQAYTGAKACACSYMHYQCAKDYVERISPNCRVCNKQIEFVRLNKRAHEEEETELERRASKIQREREACEKAENLKWARAVAPSVAHIMHRHFRHSRGGQADTSLSFSTIILSLIHSEETYVEDLSERLHGHGFSDAEVETHVKRLHRLGESLTSPEGVDEACSEEFMAHFQEALSALSERQGCPFLWPRE